MAKCTEKKEEKQRDREYFERKKSAVLAGFDSEAEDEEELKGWQGSGWTRETG